MLALGAGTKVYLACKPVSMRKGFDGLAALTREVFDAELRNIYTGIGLNRLP